MDAPWQYDACSLVDAFRRSERSPVEELEATIAAIDSSELNAFSHLDLDAAREAAANADVSLPWGGVPMAVKEVDAVEGWPRAEASLVFADRVWPYTCTEVARLRDAGAVIVGQTTIPEFGGLGISVSRLHGITRNPWNLDRSTGGSSAGSAAAVAGGLLSIATGADGGGSIRIPAGHSGLLGLKGTAGRIPRGPHAPIGPLTIVNGCMARSVRDAARWYDTCAGYDPHDPYSLPRIEGWERDLGSHDLRGKRVAIAPTLGNAVLLPAVEDLVRKHGELLAADAGLELVDVPVELPPVSTAWALTNLVVLRDELGDRWPGCRDLLTPEIAFGMDIAEEHFNLLFAARAEEARRTLNEAIADVMDQVDFVIAATNPDVAFGADVSAPIYVGDVLVGIENSGALTIPANITGVPAVSIPIEMHDGLPVGMQILGRHHTDALLLDLAAIVERERPWPLVAPGSPH